jgi:membrane protein
MLAARDYLRVLKKSAQQFAADNAVKLSASLSYYTIFSFAPLLIIVMSLTGFFFGMDAVQGKIYYQIKDLVGSDTALEIQHVVQYLRTSRHTTVGTIIGVIALLMGATGVFTEIQDSINYIWSVKAKPKKGWLKLIKNRLISFSLIISFGFILLVSLMVNAVMDVLSDELKRLFPEATVYIFYVLNLVAIFFIISCLFAIIFKVLPDAEIRWKDAFTGAFFTAFLFILGKFLIGYYLGNSRIGLTYGTAASVIIILLWVYYSSIILFFGAEFTHIYAKYYGGGIIPNDTAVFIVKQEVRELKTTHDALE